jgi:F0F1-type ATP synthase assembly protein I
MIPWACMVGWLVGWLVDYKIHRTDWNTILG